MMRVLYFYVVLQIAHLANFRSAGFTFNRMVFCDQNLLIREVIPLHRDHLFRSVTTSGGNPLFMTQEDRVVVTARDDLSILTGQFRDRNTIYSAVTNMLGDPSFLLKNNSLRIVTDALKRCATPPQKMLYFWKKAFSLGVIVRRRELKDLLYYCYEHGRGDPITIVKALETACSLEKAIYWNSVLFNLIIQIYSERLDIKLAKKRAGLLLRDIVKDIIDNNIENVMDEKSLVMLLKYFSNAEDYEAAKLVFSFRNRAAKRPIDGETAAIDVEYVENVVVWNAYLTALTKIALKVNDSGENQFSVEINEILAAMIDLKIADFYTHCIMLEFNAGKIIANKRNNNNRRSEELVNSSLEMWDNSYFLKLRESNQPYKYIDDINKGLAISYAIIIRCLLHSADSANGVKSVSSVSSTSSTLTESKKAADNYVRIALKLSFEIPSSEVASSLLYSLGLAEESCEVAIKYMHMLIERCASMSKDESKIGSKKESDGEGNSKGGDNSVSGIETTVSAEGEGTFERRNEAQNKYSTKKHPKNNRAKKDIQSQGNLISTNVVESLLGGYYASNRNDLVIQAYLLAHDNLSNTISNSRQLNALKISELNIIGGTKAFNLFLVSVREMVKGGFIDARDKEPLWQFCKGVIKERVSAETARVNREKEGSSRGNEGNRDRSGENGGRSVVKSSSDVNLFDSYSTVISMDLANMVTDYTMSKELFYGYEASSQPLPRAVQTYLRAFQAPTQLFDLDKLVNTVLDQSPRYRAMFTSNTDLTGDDARTFDEMMNAYLRVGNLPIALEYAAKYSNKFSDSAMKNLLIRFDRFWRDYDNETVYIADLLKGQERLERNNHKAMNSYLESNLQVGSALPEKNYYSEEAERHVRCPATYAALHDITGRCLAVEAGILSDILLLRAVDNPPSYVLWSVLVGVSISRGDWDTAVDVLAKMECNEDAILLKNIYKTKSSRKPIKKLYRGAVVSQTVELGVLYAIDGGLPLLTRGGVEALQAMNLERLLPKENNLDDNGDVKSSVQAPDRIVGQNIERESAVKTQKVHNLNGIAHSLSQIPKRLLLDTSNKRTVCTVGDILGFLEACRGADGVQMAQGAQVGLLDDIGESDVGSGEDYSGVGPRSFDDDSTYDDYDAYVPKKKPFKKVPVGVALLQSLFAAAINERKYKQAARIIRLLEGSRLVIDLDAPALIAVPVSVPPLPLSLSSPLSTPTGEEEYSASLTASSSVSDDKIGKVLSRSSDSPSDASAVKVVRETLARKWAALLIGSSLNKLKNNVAGSVKMMAALKYLQKEETDERNEMN